MRCTAFEVHGGELFEWIARRGFRSDMRENDLHESDDTG